MITRKRNINKRKTKLRKKKLIGGSSYSHDWLRPKKSRPSSKPRSALKLVAAPTPAPTLAPEPPSLLPPPAAAASNFNTQYLDLAPEPPNQGSSGDTYLHVESTNNEIPVFKNRSSNVSGVFVNVNTLRSILINFPGGHLKVPL